MTAMFCRRSWEAEAIEDKRLDSAFAASFERHLTQCVRCAREAQALRELSGMFGDFEPRRLSTLECRRQRAELLRRANERILARTESRRRPVALAAAVITLSLGSIGFAAIRWRGDPATERRAIGTAVVHGGSREMRVHVTPTNPAPDPNLFVDAVSGPESALTGAGSSNRRGGGAVTASRRPSSSLTPTRPSSLDSGAAAANEFAAAMAAFDSGAYLDADERFAAFSVRFPADARREDAAFLRTVVALRRGDTAAAMARAQDYLKAFPNGLRWAEIRRLVTAE